MHARAVDAMRRSRTQISARRSSPTGCPSSARGIRELSQSGCARVALWELRFEQRRAREMRGSQPPARSACFSFTQSSTRAYSKVNVRFRQACDASYRALFPRVPHRLPVHRSAIEPSQTFEVLSGPGPLRVLQAGEGASYFPAQNGLKPLLVGRGSESALPIFSRLQSRDQREWSEPLILRRKVASE